MNGLPLITIHPVTIGRQPARLLWVAMACVAMLMLFCISLPDRQIQVFGSLDGLALAKVATRVISLFLLMSLIRRSWAHPARARIVRCFQPLGLFVAWCVLSAAWSPMKSVSLGQSFGLAVLLLLAVAVALLVRTAQDVSSLLRFLCVSTVAMSTLLLLCYFLAPSTLSLTRDATGFFHSTAAGGNASLGLVILLAARLKWNWNWTRQLIAPGVLVHGSVLLLAMSRTSLALTFGVSLVVVAIFVHRAVLGAVLVAASVLVMATMLADARLDFVAPTAESTAGYVSIGQSSAELLAFSGRSEMWNTMWNSYLKSPWIGHGYFVSSESGEIEVWYQAANWTAHNMYLQALVSTGLIGAILFVRGLWRPLWLAASSIGRGDKTSNASSLLLIVTLWMLIWAMLNSFLLGPMSPMTIAFFMLLGIVIGSVQLPAPPPTPSTST